MILPGSISGSHSQLGQSVSQLVIEILGTGVREVSCLQALTVRSLQFSEAVELQKNHYMLGIFRETLCKK